MQEGDSCFHRFSEANRPKIDAKKHSKNDGKQEASWRRLGGILEVQEVSGGGGATRR